MNVTVLLGGPSAEREVSLVSGRSVIARLEEAGHRVFASDISPDDLSGLGHPADVIFPVLHGEFGESGELQEILENRGIPFVGSGSRASRLGMDKVATKQAWEAEGLATPPYYTQEGARIEAHGMDRLTVPCVVKAYGSGSSIDVYVCKDMESARRAVNKVLALHSRVLVEKYIEGPEITVGLIEEKPLPPIHIVPRAEFFDYNAKYNSPETEHRFDIDLPEAVLEQCRELAWRANYIVGARDLARVDLMLDTADNYRPYLLEINTMPGFTPRSLLPEAAAHAGLPFHCLVDRLVTRAYLRGPVPVAA